MKVLFSGALMVVALLMLSGCAKEKSWHERGLAPVTHDGLKTLMAGTRTLRWTTSRGLTGTGTFAQDGTARLSWNGGGAEGSWRISGNRFCTTYPRIRDGDEVCYTLYKTGETEYHLILPDGSLSGTWRL